MSLKPFMLRGDAPEKKLDRKRITNRKPRAHEAKVASALGGRRQPGSGAFDTAKGDVKRADKSFPLLVECKRTTGQKTLRVDSEWLSKITHEAHAVDAYPALSIEFDESIMKALPGSPEPTWVALPITVLRGLLEKAGEDPSL